MSTPGQTGAPTRTGPPTREPGGPAAGEQGDATARPSSAATSTGPRNTAVAGAAPTVGTGSGQRPAAPRAAGPRRVKLTVSRVDPWSVLKMSFLISVAIGIAGVVLMSVLWLILFGMGVFSDVNRTLSGVMDSGTSRFDLMDYIGFGRVVSLSIVIGVFDVFLMTAIATIGAFLYNVCAALVGGLRLTLSDD